MDWGRRSDHERSYRDKYSDSDYLGTFEVKRPNDGNDFSKLSEDSFSDVTIFFHQRSNGDVGMSFPFNASFMNLLKTHIPGRTFEPSTKMWVIPKMGVSTMVDFCEYLGIRVPNHINRRDSNTKTLVKISIDDIRDMKVQFLYDPLLVEIVKRIHPKRRNYNANSRNWDVSCKALPELMENLHEEFPDIIVPYKLDNLIRKIELEEEEENARSEEEDYIKKEGSNKRSSSYHESDYSSERNSSHSHNFSPKKIKAEEVKCNCGKPRSKIDGVHICRYYGSFHCPRCSNRWTSAYTWEGESQACRECSLESFPIEKRPLEKLAKSNISGAHDCSRCSMCKRKGRDCSKC